MKMRRTFTARAKSSNIKKLSKSKDVYSAPRSPKKKDMDNFEEKIAINCSEMKAIAEKIHKANLQKTQENKIKDDEIDLLNEEIRKIMLTNFDLQTSIQKELELRHTYETEQRKIANYCNDLSLKFRNMEKTIADYENTVKSMKKQNEDLADAYDKKIEEIDKENNLHDVVLKDKFKDRKTVFHSKIFITGKKNKNNNFILNNDSIIYIGSHNFSASAWGNYEKNGTQISVANYELGIIFDLNLLNYMEKLDIYNNLLFNFDCPKYSEDDKPFFTDNNL